MIALKPRPPLVGFRSGPKIWWGDVRAAGGRGRLAAPACRRTRRCKNVPESNWAETRSGRRQLDVGMGDKIAVLGKNGAGKSTLVKIIGGVEAPTAGSVHRGLFMSWPVAFSGGFEKTMSGIDNIRFIATLYQRDVEHLIAFVDDFAELGRQLLLPVRNYSSGMRMRLAFALTLAIDFECFLIDEVLAVGDQRFHRKCHDALFVARANCAMILVSHDVHTLYAIATRRSF